MFNDLFLWLLGDERINFYLMIWNRYYKRDIFLRRSTKNNVIGWFFIIFERAAKQHSIFFVGFKSSAKCPRRESTGSVCKHTVTTHQYLTRRAGRVLLAVISGQRVESIFSRVCHSGSSVWFTTWRVVKECKKLLSLCAWGVCQQRLTSQYQLGGDRPNPFHRHLCWVFTMSDSRGLKKLHDVHKDDDKVPLIW